MTIKKWKHFICLSEKKTPLLCQWRAQRTLGGSGGSSWFALVSVLPLEQIGPAPYLPRGRSDDEPHDTSKRAVLNRISYHQLSFMTAGPRDTNKPR